MNILAATEVIEPKRTVYLILPQLPERESFDELFDGELLWR